MVGATKTMAAPTLDGEGIVLTGGIRDQKTHAEIFDEGNYADVIFAVSGRDSTGKPQPRASIGGTGLPAALEVYGLKPIFALASGKFREIMEGAANYRCTREGRERLELLEGYWIPTNVTPGGFEIAACYIYKLPLRLALTTLHEVIEAASCLELPELSQACYDFGIRQYAERKFGQACYFGLGQDKEGLDAMLRCLEAWHRTKADEGRTAEWQRRLLERWSQEEVLGSPVVSSEISSETMQALLLSNAMHVDETALWNAVLRWAKVQWDQGIRPLAEEPMSPSEAQKKKLATGGSTKLFGPTAQMKPRERTGPESEWQKLLLPLSRCFQLHRLSPEAFAVGLEGTATGDESPGLIPELRSLLYAARRQAKQMVATPAKAV